jgi:plasmid stabilization system protein ParE
MRVELSPFIKGDLEAIADWIAEDNPRRAVTFIREIREEFRKIGQGPLHYQLRPEIGEDAVRDDRQEGALQQREKAFGLYYRQERDQLIH